AVRLTENLTGEARSEGIAEIITQFLDDVDAAVVACPPSPLVCKPRDYGYVNFLDRGAVTFASVPWGSCGFRHGGATIPGHVWGLHLVVAQVKDTAGLPCEPLTPDDLKRLQIPMAPGFTGALVLGPAKQKQTGDHLGPRPYYLAGTVRFWTALARY